MENHIAFGGFVVNRVHPEYAFEDSAEGSEIGKPLFEDIGFDTTLSEKIAKNFEQFDSLAKSDAAAIDGLRQKAGENVPIRPIPLFDGDIYDIPGLLQIREHLE